MYLESKVIELLMLQLEQAENKSFKSFHLDNNDKEKLFAVKELIQQNLLHNYSLKELSLEPV